MIPIEQCLPLFPFDRLIIPAVVCILGGVAGGLWIGFKLWRETYIRGLDGRTIRNVEWR